jgi:hypothetical protein
MIDFRKNFNFLTDGVLQGLNMSNMVVAGGSVLLSLLHSSNNGNATISNDQLARTTFYKRSAFVDSDVDIFLFALTPEEAIIKIDLVFAHLRQFGDTTTIRSKHAVTFLQEHPRRAVQIVLRIYQSPAEVLAGFDVDCCSVAYNGDKVWATPRSRRALNGRLNVVDDTRQSPTYESRLLKYSVRGFAVVVPGFIHTKLDPHFYQREIGEVHGMARLLLLERLTDPRTFFNLSLGRGPRGQPNSLVRLVLNHPKQNE